jgi:hypothetical protein
MMLLAVGNLDEQLPQNPLHRMQTVTLHLILRRKDPLTVLILLKFWLVPSLVNFRAISYVYRISVDDITWAD